MSTNALKMKAAATLTRNFLISVLSSAFSLDKCDIKSSKSSSSLSRRCLSIFSCSWYFKIFLSTSVMEFTIFVSSSICEWEFSKRTLLHLAMTEPFKDQYWNLPIVHTIMLYPLQRPLCVFAFLRLRLYDHRIHRRRHHPKTEPFVSVWALKWYEILDFIGAAQGPLTTFVNSQYIPWLACRRTPCRSSIRHASNAHCTTHSFFFPLWLNSAIIFRPKLSVIGNSMLKLNQTKKTFA